MGLLLYILTGRHAVLVLEVLGEALGRVVTYLIGDLGNGEATLFQELTGTLHTDKPHEIKRCNTRQGIDLLEEFVALDVQLITQLVNGELGIANVLLNDALGILQKLLIEL